MNRLPAAKRVQILSLLCEGNAMRSVSRLADVSINTVTKLLVDAGLVCAAFHDENVRGIKSKRVQCDEIWAFVGAKAKNVTPEQKADGWGDCWTWTALDADSKLLVSFLVGSRGPHNCYEFMKDVCSRLANRVQLTTDGLSWYIDAVDHAFGIDVDFGMIQKHYSSPFADKAASSRYSPAKFTSATKEVIRDNPNPKHISTSFVERANLTMRMHMRRFTRLTNGFSKKVENHSHMVALYSVWYNWMKVHKTLRVTPAMQAGLADRVFEMADLVALIEQAEAPMPAEMSERGSA
ncbi:MAG: IS1 family transposase [Vicinamibacterales bacterium]